jgi:hypothetical protein
MFKEKLDLWTKYDVAITIEYHILLDLFMRSDIFTEVKMSVVDM